MKKTSQQSKTVYNADIHDDKYEPGLVFTYKSAKRDCDDMEEPRPHFLQCTFNECYLDEPFEFLTFSEKTPALYFKNCVFEKCSFAEDFSLKNAKFENCIFIGPYFNCDIEGLTLVNCNVRDGAGSKEQDEGFKNFTLSEMKRYFDFKDLKGFEDVDAYPSWEKHIESLKTDANS